MSNRQMRLGLFMDKAGHFLSSWRYSGVPADQLFELEFYKELAQTAERGKFDMVFLADALQLFPENNFRHTVTVHPDPIVLLSTLASVTSRIGLAATVSTSYNEPFNVARKFATLDLLSKGRAAWNVVTSMRDDEGRNFNRDKHYEHAERYEIAEEFLTVAKKLWDSWEDQTILADQASGVYADPDKVHAIHHRGTHFKVQGPLNVPRPTQGHPVLIQAGSSPAGRAFAARHSEVIFTVSPNIQVAKEFYSSVKQLAVEYGRAADDIKVLPGVIPIVGKTQKEAEEQLEHIRQLLIPESAVIYLSQFLEFDLTSYPHDQPVPALPDTSAINGQKGRYKLIKEMANNEQLTLGQAAIKFATSRMHPVVCGTASQIADWMEMWFNENACDGFNILPPYFPKGLDSFVEEVVPELQSRGLFRTEYTGHTLRDHLELKRPIGELMVK